MLRPDDTIQFFTSPYRRTRETTEGILSTLTSNDAEQGPSPFLRQDIKVYEEPRLREQDFGNFQPCSAEMERMWQERADYGHFFYRIPNGESAADAYDRVSGFNESLWRQFGDADFPSVCVLVTHGLMTRIFLMKWYHWSVEYFEDLRNVNHCETIVMKQNLDNGKFVLQNELRTWSDLRRRTPQTDLTQPTKEKSSSHLPGRIWGGCVNGCDHATHSFPRRVRRQNTMDYLTQSERPATSHEPDTPNRKKNVHISKSNNASTSSMNNRASNTSGIFLAQRSTIELGSQSFQGDGNATPSGSSAPNDLPDSGDVERPEIEHADSSGLEEAEASDADDSGDSPNSASPRNHLQMSASVKANKQVPISVIGLDVGGLRSGGGTPYISDDADESDYFDTNIHQLNRRMTQTSLTPSGLSQIVEGGPTRSNSKGKKQTTKQWKADSGMTRGKRADALGDVDGEGEEIDGEAGEEATDEGDAIEEMKVKDRASFSEVY
ncbi:phosphoglycerate mutase-like protein [Venturia nashicola]|uniref:Phosphoglycerate mutase-like protein n=1 Tax=Venturia nashicola TaxID=86259 RepID=A0A4Z1PEP0_9PEZI|nr:phosphoglycerate mutase-like protein [Venturia nashicola]